MNLYLIGYRATGKSRVGRRLSVLLGWGLVDMDEVLSARLGVTIREFVSQRGWPAFRREEKRLLAEILPQKRLVVSTGGGVVLDEDNTQGMRRHGKVAWLTASAETIRRRLLADADSRNTRPPLTESAGIAAEIEQTLAERVPLYRLAADFSIDTDGATEEEVCRSILRHLGDITKG